MKSRRFLSIFLVLCMILCSSCSSSGNYSMSTNGVGTSGQSTCLVGNIPCNFPLVTDDTKLNIMISSYDGMSPDNVYVWQKYEEMTGVDVAWDVQTKDSREEAVYLALTNHSNVDLIMRCQVPQSSLNQYGENGLILNLMDDNLLETYAPNCWAYLQSHPDTLASIMNPDGSIYSLPQINSGVELRVSRKIFVNKVWLDQLGLTLPTTTEEFYQMCVAFRDGDPNGNGIADEIPLCCPDWKSIQEGFYGAFGLANRGVHNQIVDYDETTGGVRYIPASDSYRDFLTYFNRLYSENLLDNHVFTITKDQWQTNIENDKVGVFISTNLSFVPAEQKENWVAIDTALIGPNGDQMWTAIRANFHSVGAAVIPANCSNPGLVLQWLDYFWTDEGTLFYHMGVENETYVANDDGTYAYTDAIYDEMLEDGATFDNVVSQYSPYPGGSNPTVEIAPYFMGGEMEPIAANAARGLFQYGPSEYWPSFTFSPEETATLNSISPDLDKYCSDMRIAFITGEKPLDEWDSYISQLNSLHTDEYLATYQQAVDRYNTLKEESEY